LAEKRLKKQVKTNRQAANSWRLIFSYGSEYLLPDNPMPEFDVPGGAAVLHDQLDHKRHPVSFRITHIRPPHLSLAIDQNEIVLSRMLKKFASGVLAPLSCSRTPLYAPPAKWPAALLDGTF
jgi:hypothetical protein